METKTLTKEVYEELPHISMNLNIQDDSLQDLKYIGFCVIEKNKRGIKSYCGELKNFLKPRDIKKIAQWQYSEKSYYLDRYYRLDFEQYIFIFQEYQYKGQQILLGNLLKKDFDTRLNLIQYYQEHLMRSFIHGSTPLTG